MSAHQQPYFYNDIEQCQLALLDLPALQDIPDRLVLPDLWDPEDSAAIRDPRVLRDQWDFRVDLELLVTLVRVDLVDPLDLRDRREILDGL
jgi:hypothetical protein